MENNKPPKLFDSKPAKFFFSQMAFGTAFTYLTSGVFLSGLAILMGAGDVLVSYLSVIVNICGVLILALAAFLERFRSRKRLTISLTVLTKLTTLLIVAIPALIPAPLRLAVFVPLVVAAFTLQAQATVALNNWMIVFIGEKRRGRYISARQTLSLIVTVALSLGGGYLMDAARGEYIGFVMIFLAAFLMGAVEIILLTRIPDHIAPAAPEKKRGVFGSIKLPLRDKPYLAFVIYISAFYLLLNVADSFTMVYMMRYLELPYQLTTAFYMLISLPQIVLLGVWGRISDKRGHAFALKASIWFFTGETLFMAFAAPGSYFIFIPAAFITASVANAGFTVAVFNRRYEFIPDESRIIYDNFYTAAIGAGTLLGPVIGGALKTLLESSGALAEIAPFAAIRSLYVISTLGILLLQIVYSRYTRLNSVSV